MRVVLAFLCVLAVLCSCMRRRTAPASATDGGAIAELPPLPSIEAPAPKYTALGVCNRIVATGAASKCQLSEAGLTVSFSTSKGGRGLVMVARDKTQLQTFMNEQSFGEGKTAFSTREPVLVVWWGGDEIVDGEIRLAVVQL